VPPFLAHIWKTTFFPQSNKQNAGLCNHKTRKPTSETDYLLTLFIYLPADIVGSNPKGDMDVCCKWCVWSGRGLCDELLTRPEESYRL